MYPVCNFIFNMHKPHCVTDYCEFVESQISYPNCKKGFLDYRNIPILLSRQNFYKYLTRTDIPKSIMIHIIKKPKKHDNELSGDQRSPLRMLFWELLSVVLKKRKDSSQCYTCAAKSKNCYHHNVLYIKFYLNVFQKKGSFCFT